MKHAWRGGRNGFTKGKGDISRMLVLFVILIVMVLWTDRYTLKFTRQYTLGVGSLFVNYTTIPGERSEDFGLA